MKEKRGMVLFTQRVEIVESYGERRDCADQNISEFIYKCGFLPIPVPNKAFLVKSMMETLEPAGIVLTGGNSLVKYGGNAAERDETDRALIECAIEKNIPVYGFCRGMQSIIDYFGGILQNVSGHVAVRHDVDGTIVREVNSFHNQACIELSEETGLIVLAKTADGVIEAIKHHKYPIVGTMWHPEREMPFCDIDIMTVKNLFQGE